MKEMYRKECSKKEMVSAMTVLNIDPMTVVYMMLYRATFMLSTSKNNNYVLFSQDW